jgi:hypothetical protein
MRILKNSTGCIGYKQDSQAPLQESTGRYKGIQTEAEMSCPAVITQRLLWVAAQIFQWRSMFHVR